MVTSKVHRARSKGLKAIVCIGEKKDDRDNDTVFETLAAQLEAIKAAEVSWRGIVLAYEPVGANSSCQESHEFIRGWIRENVSEDVAEATRIIYGGSVNDKNCTTLISLPDVDGFLVGGASIKPNFRTLVDLANEYAVKGPEDE